MTLHWMVWVGSGLPAGVNNSAGGDTPREALLALYRQLEPATRKAMTTAAECSAVLDQVRGQLAALGLEPPQDATDDH